MRYSSILSSLISTALLATQVSAALDPIVIKGSKFFYQTNGTQFFIRGVAYPQDASQFSDGAAGSGTTSSSAGYADPLADTARCQIDIPLMAQLRTNTIRVYAVDPTQDHSVCMGLLEQYGIYVFADLSEPSVSITSDDPSWDSQTLNRYTSVVDAFANYTNVIGFFAGNEVTNQTSNTNATAYVRAAVRDLKAYVKQKNIAKYIGYATDDDPDVRTNVADYFNCGDQTTAVDFYGYNIYSWCGDSDYVTSGYMNRTIQYSSYSVPVFFAEYGCNKVEPRVFTEVQALFGSNMTSVFSGGIVYEWFQESNNYGKFCYPRRWFSLGSHF
jgi:hypothetical protein